MQYDHHKNTTERALASEVSVASFTLSFKKSHFFREEVTFLG